MPDSLPMFSNGERFATQDHRDERIAIWKVNAAGFPELQDQIVPKEETSPETSADTVVIRKVR